MHFLLKESKSQRKAYQDVKKKVRFYCTLILFYVSRHFGISLRPLVWNRRSFQVYHLFFSIRMSGRSKSVDQVSICNKVSRKRKAEEVYFYLSLKSVGRAQILCPLKCGGWGKLMTWMKVVTIQLIFFRSQREQWIV